VECRRNAADKQTGGRNHWKLFCNAGTALPFVVLCIYKPPHWTPPSQCWNWYPTCTHVLAMREHFFFVKMSIECSVRCWKEFSDTNKKTNYIACLKTARQIY
jgi:hypothetical protein